jgi:hypothetical protein
MLDNPHRSRPRRSAQDRPQWPRKTNTSAYWYQARLKRSREERSKERALKAELAAFRAPLIDTDGNHWGWVRLRRDPDRAPRPVGVAFGLARGVGEAEARP